MKKTYTKAIIAIASSSLIIPVLVLAQNTTTSTSTSSTAPVRTCPLIKTYMNLGRTDNRSEEVTKLQTFLKNSENLDVDINGTFDQKTDAAVRAFQKKYADEILNPWGGTKTSGYVYIMTSKKINQIACDQPLTLNDSDRTAIQNFRSRLGSSDVAVASVPAPAPSAQPVPPIDPDEPVSTAFITPAVTPTTNPSVTPEVDSEDEDAESAEDTNEDVNEDQDESENLAASAETSVAKRFFAFLRGLFN